jgi:adenylate cyclase
MEPRPVPPRVDRAFAFFDLCGFTDFADACGDEDAADMLHLLRGSVREAATYHGVRVDKWLGDGAMLVAVEVPALLAAAVEIKWALQQKAVLPVRGGVAAGPVMVFEGDDYVGRSVNLAAKLCDLAEPGEILAPAAVAEGCPVGVHATPVGSRQVPGFAHPLDLVEIDATPDDAGEHRRGLAAAVAERVESERVRE